MPYRNTLRQIVVLVTVAVTVMATQPAWAAPVWTNASTGDWFDTGNWNPATLPTTNDDAKIQNGGTATIGADGALAGSLETGTGASVSGHINISSGSLTIGNRDAGGANSLILRFNSTYTQTGGTATFGQIGGNGALVGVSNGSAVMSVSGGTATFNSRLELGKSGTGTLNVSGTGQVIVRGNLNVIALGASGTPVGVVNLDGGTLTVNQVQRATPGLGTSTFNFNGGTLKALVASTAFVQGLDFAYVKAGGAIIDTNGQNVTIGQALLHDPALGAAADGGLTKNASGTLTLTGASTYTGATTVNAGALNIQNAAALGTAAGGTTVANGARVELAGGVTVTGETLTISGSGGNNFGALQTASGDNEWAGTVILNGADTRVGADTGTLRISGPIQNGTLGTIIVRNNTGSTIFSGANTYTGETLVYNGVLQIDGGDNRLPTGTVLRLGINSFVRGTFDLNGRNQTVAGLTVNGSDNLNEQLVTNTKAGTTSVITVNNSADWTFAGRLTNAAGATLALTKSGGGKLTLTNSNDYAGITTVSAGVLNIQNAQALGTTAAGTTVANAARLELAGNITIVGESLTISGNGGNSFGALQTASGDNEWAGTVILNGADTRVGANTGTLKISGPIQNGTLGTIIVRNNTGSTIFSGANTYTGETLVYNGVLQIDGGDNRLPTTTVLRLGINSGVRGTFDLNGRNQTVAGLAVNGSDNLNEQLVTNTKAGTTSVITVNNSVDWTFAGRLTNAAGATLALTKSGAGKLTLTNGNDYAGTTTVNAGVLTIQNATALGSTAAGTSVENGATLQLQGNIAVAGEALTIGEHGVGGQGALRNISGDNSWSTVVTMRSGVQSRIQSDSGKLTLSGGIASPGGNSLFLSGAGNGEVSGPIGGVFQLAKEGTGTWTLSAANTYTAPTNVNGGTLLLNSGSGSSIASTAVNIGTGSVGAVLLLGASNQINDAAVLTLNGAGANAGLFRLANANETIGGLASTGGAGIVENEAGTAGTATLTVNVASGTQTFSGVLRDGDGTGTDGTLALVKSGAGTQVLSGANTFTGATTVNAGAINIQNAQALGSTAAGTTVENGATLQLQGNIAVAGEALTIGDHGVGNQGALRNIGGDNSWSALVTMRNGVQSRIQSDSGKLTLSGGIASPGGNTLVLSGAGNGEVSGPIGGLFQLVKEGSGTWTLSAANTYSTPTNVNAGTLALVSAASNNNIPGSPTIRVAGGATLDVTGLAGTADLILASGQTLKGNGTVLGNLSIPLGATIAAGDSPGHLIQTGNYTQAGTMDVEIQGRTQGVTYDWIDVSGTALVNGLVKVTLGGGFVPEYGDAFDVLTASGVTVGPNFSIDGSAAPLLPAQYWSWRIAPYGTGGQQALELFVGVPEPASLSLLALGAAAWLGWNVRRRRVRGAVSLR